MWEETGERGRTQQAQGEWDNSTWKGPEIEAPTLNTLGYVVIITAA